MQSLYKKLKIKFPKKLFYVNPSVFLKIEEFFRWFREYKDVISRNNEYDFENIKNQNENINIYFEYIKDKKIVNILQKLIFRNSYIY